MTLAVSITSGLTPAEIARDEADGHADHHDDDLGAHAHEHGHPCPEDHAREHVAAQLIGAERELAGGKLVDLAEIRLRIRVGRNEVREDRHEAEQDHRHATHDRELVAEEATPGIPPEVRGLRGQRRREPGGGEASTGCGGR